VDVRLSPEQQALRDSAAKLVGRLGPETVRALDDGERRSKLDAAVEAAGWWDLRTDDGSGAPVSSGVEAAIVAEEMARGRADAPFIGPTLACDLRRRAGVEAAQHRETGDRADAAGAAALLELHGLDLVRKPVSGVAGSIDLTRSAAGTLGEPAVIGRLTADDAEGWNALGLALSCADLVGAMQGTTELAVAYAGQRQQYGAAIGSFQAVQHLLADAHVAAQGSKSVALHAAWAVDALPPAEARDAAAIAKAYCARAARIVCETSIQVHGGIGNTWECLAHVYLRRTLVSTDLFGGVGECLDRIGRAHGLR
jgi:alkylation response protein AidB-like acyl-CoA dehydrogenase